MAKVTAPLMSMSASGQFGKTIVFDKRGIAREYVVPSNPQTVGQMAVRNKLGDIQRELKLLGPVLRGQLKTQFGPRWNSMIVGELTANNGAALTSYTGEHTAFTTQQKTDWATADGATPVALADGLVLYAAASAVYDMAARLGATVTLALPAAANSTTVGGQWTA